MTRASGEAGQGRMEGALFFFAAIALIPVVDATAKALTTDMHPFQVTWGRYASNVVLLLPYLLWRYGPKVMARPAQPGLQALRGLALVASTFCFFWGLSALPLAEALALAFTYPLIITLTAPFFLGETFGWRRLMAAIVGFVGALLVIRPGFGETSGGLGIEALGGLGAGAFFAVYAMATRKLGAGDPPVLTLFWGAVIGTAVASIATFGVWRAPTSLEWGGFAAMGMFAGLAHFFIVLAFARADASFLAPFGYVEILFATVIGFFVFGDFPALTTWIGTAIIVSSGAYTMARERKRARDQAS